MHSGMLWGLVCFQKTTMHSCEDLYIKRMVNYFLDEGPWYFKTSKHQGVLKHLVSFKLQYLLSLLVILFLKKSQHWKFRRWTVVIKMYRNPVVTSKPGSCRSDHRASVEIIVGLKSRAERGHAQKGPPLYLLCLYTAHRLLPHVWVRLGFSLPQDTASS